MNTKQFWPFPKRFNVVISGEILRIDSLQRWHDAIAAYSRSFPGPNEDAVLNLFSMREARKEGHAGLRVIPTFTRDASLWSIRGGTLREFVLKRQVPIPCS